MEKRSQNLPLIITDHLISDHKPVDLIGFSFYLAGLVQGCGIVDHHSLILQIPGIERSLTYYLKKKLGYGEIDEIDEIESIRRVCKAVSRSHSTISHFIFKAVSGPPLLSNHLSNLSTTNLYSNKYPGKALLFLYELIKNKLIMEGVIGAGFVPKTDDQRSGFHTRVFYEQPTVFELGKPLQNLSLSALTLNFGRVFTPAKVHTNTKRIKHRWRNPLYITLVGFASGLKNIQRTSSFGLC